MRRFLALPAVVVLAAVGLVLVSPGSPGTAAAADEATLAGLVNGARSSAGLPALTVSAGLSDTARSHSAAMAAAGSLFHSGNLAGAIGGAVTGWTSVAENVAVAGSVTEAHQALMASAVHRANILGDFTLLGVGVVQGGDGRVWVTEHFAKTTTVAAPPEPAPAPAPETTPALAPVVVTVAAAVEAVVPAPAPAPAPTAAPRTPRPSTTRTVRTAPASVAPAAPDGSECLPEQAEGQGWAYGRCDRTGPARVGSPAGTAMSRQAKSR